MFTITTSTGTVLTVTKTLGKKATHVVVASTTASWDRMENLGGKSLAKERKADMNRFGAPVNGEYIMNRSTSEKGAQKLAETARTRGESVEVIAL